MASDRHGVHNKRTISFRVTDYQEKMIRERVKLSGMLKQDYISRCCIYSKVCTVGHPKTLRLIRRELSQMYDVLKDINDDFRKLDLSLSDDGLKDMAEDYEAFLEAILWMLEGAKYLWEDVEDDE